MYNTLKCIANIEPFITGNIYKADSRTYIDKQTKEQVVLIIEKTVNEENYCYLLPIDTIHKYFKIIN